VKVFENLDEFAASLGTRLGPTDWMHIDQDRVNGFADVTNDHQWIHVDPKRAADGPYGGTIAHGLLTLALVPQFSQQLFRIDKLAMGINYGYNKVRFISPVRVGSDLRARGEISAISQLEGAVQATITVTIEIAGSEKPAAVVEAIGRYIG